MLITCPNEEDNASHKLMKWKCYEKVVHANAIHGMQIAVD
jgi:hypothetical protein